MGTNSMKQVACLYRNDSIKLVCVQSFNVWADCVLILLILLSPSDRKEKMFQSSGPESESNFKVGFGRGLVADRPIECQQPLLIHSFHQ